jgi:hypothetical protein
VGAGISASGGLGDDLPSGKALGRLLNERFKRRVAGYAPPADPSDLLAVADAAELGGSEELVRREVLELAEFRTATPNDAHRNISLLLCEGAITVLSWNWDTCIERARDERLRVARTSTEMADLQPPLLVKVHGCADIVSSLLVTSKHLSAPPDWAEQTLSEQLPGSPTVFVGIGDVADYAQRRLGEVTSRVNHGTVFVVSRSIKRNWSESHWSVVLSDLDEDRRVEKAAIAFFQDFAQAWLAELYEALAVAATNNDCVPQEATDRVVEACGQMNAADVIEWLRKSSMKIEPGQSAVMSTNTTAALLALGCIAETSGGTVKVSGPATCQVGEEELQLLLVRDLRGTEAVRREARRRASELAERRGPIDEACFLVSGTVIGSLKHDEIASVDVHSGSRDPQDIFDGQTATRLKFTLVHDVLGSAA